MRDVQIIAASEDGRYRIVADAQSKPTPWITRRNLHAWVWAQPVARVTEMLGLHESVGWLCWIYDVPRPPLGYFHKSSEKREAAFEPLSSNRNACEPVPIVNFRMSGDGLHTARVRAPMDPAAQLGAPGGRNLVHPRTAERTRLAAPAIGGTGQLVCLAPTAFTGPPEPMTRGLLHQIIWRKRDDEITYLLGLYGLTQEEVVKLTLANDVGTLPPFREVSTSTWDEPFARRHHKAIRKRLSPTEKRQIVDISPVIRAALTAEVAQDRAAYERGRQERITKQRELRERRKERADLARERLPQIIGSACKGVGIAEAAAAEGIDAASLIQAISSELKVAGKPRLVRWKQAVVRTIRRGGPLSPPDIIMMADLIGPQKVQALTWRGVTSARYVHHDVTVESRVRLVDWLHSAGEVQEAMASVACALEECRTKRLAADDTSSPAEQSASPPVRKGSQPLVDG